MTDVEVRLPNTATTYTLPPSSAEVRLPAATATYTLPLLSTVLRLGLLSAEVGLWAGGFQMTITANNVLNYGAVGDGSTDDATAIQAAIDALPAQGGIVYLPRARYVIGTGLTLGNGSSSAVSTQKHITFLGDGCGAAEDEINGRNGATEIAWNGTAGGTMLTINGPIAGVRIEGIGFDAKLSSNAAATVISSNHVLNSVFRQISIERWTGVAIDVAAYQNPTGCADGADDVIWENVHVRNPDSTTAGCVRLGSSARDTSPYLDVARHLFQSCDFESGSSGVSIELRFCDACTFIQCVTGGGTGVKVTVPTGTTTFPNSIWFYNCPIVGGTSLSGTWNDTHHIWFWPYPTGDGQAVPTATCFRGITARGEAFNLPQMVVRRTPATVTTVGAATYTAAQFEGGLILRDPVGSDRSDVTPTAALIVAALPGIAADDTFECLLVNTADAAETITVTAGTNVTLVPATVTIAQNESARLVIRPTDVGSGTEAVTIYAMVAGG